MTSSVYKKNFRERLYIYRFYLLFFTLLLNFFIPPFSVSPLLKVTFSLFTVIIMLLSAANFIQKDNKFMRTTWFLFGFINICFAVLSTLFPDNSLIENTQYILLFFFFSGVTVSLLVQIINIKEVTMDVIVGSFCGYILIGVISFFIFSLIEISIPDSLSGLSGDFNNRISQIFYFTFSCLTTIGFGDILPLNYLSQKLAVFTGALGQFYIAVVVAILVSRFMHRSDKTNQ